MKKRIISMLLATLMVSAAFVGCTEQKPSDTDISTETSVDTSSEQEPNTTPYPVDILKIFDKSIGDFVIVHADDASKSITDAAAELASYIEKACGAKLEVKKVSESTSEYEIVIDKTDRDTKAVTDARASLGLDGYYIHAENNKLFLGGDSNRSTFYAVYGFLEDYIGCRYYTKDYERILEKHEINIASDLHYTITPRFYYRESGYGDRSREQTFATKMRTNGCQWNLTGGNETDNKMYYAGSFCHTLWQLLGREKHENDWQPCLTDETVYTTVLEAVRKQLRAQPDASFISVSQSDSFDGKVGCECDNCKAVNTQYQSEGATLMLFVNRIARDIKEEFPDVQVDTLAYRYTQKPPVGIRMEDNVIVRLCPIEACCCHSYEECTSEATKTYKKDLEEWSKICDNLFVWYYSENTATFHMPYPNIIPMHSHFNMLSTTSAQGVYFEGYGTAPNTDLMNLRVYMGAKLLWNPDMTKAEYDEILNDFLEGYYGDGWRYIREYIDTLMTKLSPDKHMKCGDGPRTYLDFDRRSDSDNALLDTMLSLWDKALAEAKTEDHKNHVEKSSISWMYYYLFSKGCSKNPELATEMYERMKRQNATQISYATDVLNVPDFDPTKDGWLIVW